MTLCRICIAVLCLSAMDFVQADPLTTAAPGPETTTSVPVATLPEPIKTLPTPTTSTLNQTAAEKPNLTLAIPAPPTLQGKAFLLVDYESGRILAEHNSQTQLPPASLTKLMTIYLVADRLQKKHMNLSDPAIISERAWRMGGSRMFAKVGSSMSVSDLLQGAVVASGNDSCVALAEHVGGSETSFADLMNAQAKALGMNHSHFIDSTGMPHPEHLSTAQDLAILSRAFIRQFPEYYRWFSQKWFTWNGIRQPNRNRLLWRDPTVDGLKTGHTEEAGFCLVASAKRQNMRLIGVLLGEPADGIRFDDMQTLLDYGFRYYRTYPMYPAKKPIRELHVWMGTKAMISAGVEHDWSVTIPKDRYAALRLQVQTLKNLEAPIRVGQQVGKIQAWLDKDMVSETTLVALSEVPLGNFWQRSLDRVRRLWS